MPPRYIPGRGNPRAKLLILGEAPGREEDETGFPFQGPSGQLLDDWLHFNNYDREDAYITNVVKFRPPNNDWSKLSTIGVDLEACKAELRLEIRAINPNCILSLGNHALNAIAGVDKITHYRGSILQSIYGYPKVVPTFHPAAFLWSDGKGEKTKYAYYHICQNVDIPRAIEESQYHDFKLPKRNLWIAKSATQVLEFFGRHRNHKLASIDVEIYKQGISCIAFAFDEYESVSIPLVNTLLGFKVSDFSLTELSAIWGAVDAILSDPTVTKLGQNFKFDHEKLTDIGFTVKGQVLDTALLGHIINPEYPSRKLEFWTSIYTREPYYKEEGKEFNPKRDKIDRLLLYNAKDAVVTIESYHRMTEELNEDETLKEFYNGFVIKLHQFYRDIEAIGLVLNKEEQKRLSEKYHILVETTRKELAELAGHPVNFDSPKQIGELLFEQLGIPSRKDTGEDTLAALLANTVKNEVHRDIINKILKGRKYRKAKSTYIDIQPDYDGRIRTTYNINGTDTGRSSTSQQKPPVRPCKMGLAQHTLTKRGIGKDVREMLEVLPGCVLVELDYSQAEARVVALLANDDVLLKLFNSIDVHKLTASWCFDKKIAKFTLSQVLELVANDDPLCKMLDVHKEERFVGKTVRHAGNYDIGKHELMTKLMTDAKEAGMDDFHISEYKCGIILDKFHAFSPNIRSVFHAAIENIITGDKTLYNPFGRRRISLNRESEVRKSLIAHIPQSTVPDALRYAAFRAKDRNPEIKYCIEWHDALYLMAPESLWKEQAVVVMQEMERPINFAKCSIPRGDLVIPAEIKLYRKNLAISEDVNKGELLGATAQCRL